MTADELRAIEERAEKATWPSTPGFSLDRLGPVVCDVHRLAAALRAECAENESLRQHMAEGDRINDELHAEVDEWKQKHANAYRAWSLNQEEGADQEREIDRLRSRVGNLEAIVRRTQDFAKWANDGGHTDGIATVVDFLREANV